MVCFSLLYVFMMYNKYITYIVSWFLYAASPG